MRAMLSSSAKFSAASMMALSSTKRPRRQLQPQN
jgi:hypothetical protein